MHLTHFQCFGVLCPCVGRGHLLIRLACEGPILALTRHRDVSAFAGCSGLNGPAYGPGQLWPDSRTMLACLASVWLRSMHSAEGPLKRTHRHVRTQDPSVSLGSNLGPGIPRLLQGMGQAGHGPHSRILLASLASDGILAQIRGTARGACSSTYTYLHQQGNKGAQNPTWAQASPDCCRA